MKTFILLIILWGCVACSGSLLAQSWQWVAGSTGGSEGYGMANDPWGKCYTSGNNNVLGSNVIIGPNTLTGYGLIAAIAAEFDASGNAVWASNTRNGFAIPFNIKTDAAGNLYMLGYYISNTITIGSFTLSNPDSVDELFLVKFTSSGVVQWAINLGAGNTDGRIAVKGGVEYVAGSFNSSTKSIGAFTLTNTDPSGSTADIFLSEIDSSGNIIFAQTYGGSGEDKPTGLAVASSGIAYLAGSSSSPTIAFGSTTLTNVDTSLFLVRLDTAANPVWAKNQQGIGKLGSWVGNVACDAAEDVFVVGSCRSVAYFGSYVLPVDTTSNIYLAKYDPLGNISWVKEITGNGVLSGDGVVVDNCDNVWICGGMGNVGQHGSLYIKIDSNKLDTPTGSRDPMFIAELTNNGTYIRSAALPTGGDDGSSIGVDGVGNIYIGGDFWKGPYTIGGITISDPDPGNINENIFVVKFGNSGADTDKVNTVVCMADSAVLQAPPGYTDYQWDDGSMQAARTVYTPGTYNLYCTGKCGSGILAAVFIVNYGHLDTTYSHTDTSICLHAHTVLTAPDGYSPYLWSDGSTTQKDTINAPGNYLVIGTGTCKKATIFDTFYVTKNSIDLAFSLGPDTSICNPYYLEIDLSGVTYLWEDGTTGNTDIAANTGIYYARVNELACYNTDSVTIDYLNLAQHLQDTVICNNLPIELILHANVPPGAIARWSTGNDEDSIIVRNAGQYYVTVTDAACMGTDTTTVASRYCDCEAILPGAFTPNNDGRNDTYYPLFDRACDVFDYTFCIYNRWGQLVFSTHDISEKWDGKYKGIPQDAGTFMYFLEYHVGTIYNKHVQKGDLVLIK